MTARKKKAELTKESFTRIPSEGLIVPILSKTAALALSKLYYKKNCDGTPIEHAAGLFWCVASTVDWYGVTYMSKYAPA